MLVFFHCTGDANFQHGNLPARALDTVVTFKGRMLFEVKAPTPREQEAALCIDHSDLRLQGSPDQTEDGYGLTRKSHVIYSLTKAVLELPKKSF